MAANDGVYKGSGRVRLPKTVQDLAAGKFQSYTTTQRNALANVEGQVVYDSTLKRLILNVGNGWKNPDGTTIS